MTPRVIETDTMIATAHDRRLESTAAPRAAGRPGLTRDEEVELATRAAAGDRMARDRMVEANLGLVHTIARDFRGRGLEPDDLVGEGRLGLFCAVEHFDHHYGTRFSTYATCRIKQAIREALINTTATVRLPTHVVRLVRPWRRAERALRRETGRAPSFEEVAASLDLTARQQGMVARAMVAGRLGPTGPADADAGDEILTDVVDPRAGVDERTECEDEREWVLRRLARLDDSERTVVTLRYGLGGEELSFREIGRRLELSAERVRKLDVRALNKLGKVRTGPTCESRRAGER
jgi:RNA polymerase primary sigma factor